MKNPILDKKDSNRTFRNEGINYPVWLELSSRSVTKPSRKNQNLGFRFVRNAS